MIPRLAVAGMTAAFALLCAGFVWQPHIASFADDSVSYLLAAQALSPWHPASPLILEAYRHESPYPPLYPLLLAATGAAHNLPLAHALSALAIAAWLPLVYLLGVRWLESRAAAACTVLATALLPALWINAKPLLSEPLYGLLLLTALYVLDRSRSQGRSLLAVALVFSALVLTRSAGLVLVLAYLAWAVTRREYSLRERIRRAVPALIAFTTYAVWISIRPGESQDNNAAVVAHAARAWLAAPQALPALGALMARQAAAIAEAWTGSLMVYWVPGRPVPVAVAAVMGAFALAGLGLRLAWAKPDGWISAGYLATFLVWPFYDQMGRFLFPLLPVLLLYGFDAVRRLSASLPRPALAFGIAAFALLSLEVPALAFIFQRARIGGASAEIIDWYRTPGLEQARARARVHLDLLADMDEISRSTPADARVMWVTPGYIALLAGRRAVRSPDPELPPAEYRRLVEASGAQYLFLSQFHPRDTIHDTAWRAGLDAMIGHAEVLHSRADASGTRLTSLLLRIGKQRVAAR